MSENKFEVGSIVEGKVLKLKPFGAIVELDSTTQGLVHISQVANGFVQDINEHLKEGDTVKVKVINIDSENNKISLSIRDALPQQARQRKTFNNNQKRSFSEDNRQSTSANNTAENQSTTPVDPMAAFEDKLKEFNKQATERQASLNKRNNRR